MKVAVFSRLGVGLLYYYIFILSVFSVRQWEVWELPQFYAPFVVRGPLFIASFIKF
jgi:hypothetical protein